MRKSIELQAMYSKSPRKSVGVGHSPSSVTPEYDRPPTSGSGVWMLTGTRALMVFFVTHQEKKYHIVGRSNSAYSSARPWILTLKRLRAMNSAQAESADEDKGAPAREQTNENEEKTKDGEEGGKEKRNAHLPYAFLAASLAMTFWRPGARMGVAPRRRRGRGEGCAMEGLAKSVGTGDAIRKNVEERKKERIWEQKNAQGGNHLNTGTSSRRREARGGARRQGGGTARGGRRDVWRERVAGGLIVGRTTHAERADGDVTQDGAQSVQRGEYGLSGREEEDGVQGCLRERTKSSVLASSAACSTSRLNAKSMYSWSVRRVHVRSADVPRSLVERVKARGRWCALLFGYYADSSHHENFKGKTSPSRTPCAPAAGAARSLRSPAQPPQQIYGSVIIGAIVVVNRRPRVQQGVQKSIQEYGGGGAGRAEMYKAAAHGMGGAARVASGDMVARMAGGA
ncbi:hypothetical protein C8J57DRAFT_1248879 [Mycena rebaudengoi]|nr:hypothetical protein C8J57DRAFT_1248879 [Mycena rebaudengoi]